MTERYEIENRGAKYTTQYKVNGKIYKNLAELAAIFNLHPYTIRTYVKKGKAPDGTIIRTLRVEKEQ